MSHVEVFTLTDNVEPVEMPPQTAFHLGLLFTKEPFYGFSVYKWFSSYAEIITSSDYEQEFPHTDHPWYYEEETHEHWPRGNKT